MEATDQVLVGLGLGLGVRRCSGGYRPGSGWVSVRVRVRGQKM